MTGIRETGIPSQEELKKCRGIPSVERMKKGRVACIECIQEIPCNPCEGSCHYGAITIGDQITNTPVLNEDKCIGCGMCIANCSGLAITVLDWTFAEDKATVDFPFEYLPLPQVGDQVDAVGRDGRVLCHGEIVEVKQNRAFSGTTIIRMAIPKEYIHDVRSMKRLRNE